MVAIRTKKLKKAFKDVVAVNDLNLEINQGELFALLGVNGAGKTTTIKMLSCIIRATEGEINVLGYDSQKDSHIIKQLIGVSPQETAVAPGLTVKENIEFMANIYGLKNKERINEIIQKLSLSQVQDRKAKNLSGGYQRRLSIAMALVSAPKILFLDEPTLGLDVLARRELWKFIKELKGEVTIILTTHYMEEAESLADRIGIMSQGRLIAQGDVQELKRLADTDNFEDAFVALATGDLT